SLLHKGQIAGSYLDTLAGSARVLKLSDHVVEIRGAHCRSAGRGRRTNGAFGQKGGGPVGNDLTVNDQRTWLAESADACMIRTVLHFSGKFHGITLGAAESRAGDPCQPPPVVSL